jgi:para-aminobenzoate synthetase component 1
MDEIKKVAGKITDLHTENIILGESFLDFAARFAALPGTVVLMSGGDLDCARYHIMAAKPWLTFSGCNDKLSIKLGGKTYSYSADPFSTLRGLINLFRREVLDAAARKCLKLPAPIATGLLGYLSYDLKDRLEDLPRTSVDHLHLPHIYFFAPSILVVHDKKKDRTRLWIPIRHGSETPPFEDDLETFKTLMKSGPPEAKTFRGDTGGFRSNFDRPVYLESVEKIKDYIASGDVYQVNMSQRFEMDFSGDVFSLFQTLYRRNPAPFFAYIHAEDHHIVSTSPERFILRTANQVETRPIKGTRPRGNTPVEDKRLRHELEQSRKDDAELSMIVDLLRNDIGKVCQAGSVRVDEHKRVEAYQNVYHLVSRVEGLLDKGFDSVDLIKATFPGGSITGCPKIRSMEIIDELEPDRRHIYTGSIGYISFHDTMDLSIAIRTATICNGKIIFSVGGGIVYDSDPADEYDETLHKGQTLMEVFGGNGDGSKGQSYAWMNGTLVPLDQASVPVTDPGMQYGYGFFETIRVDKGKPRHLEAHLQRFSRSWKSLFAQEPPDLTWHDVIQQVILRNGLETNTAAVKMMATRGDRVVPPYNHSLVVMVRPYTHRLAQKEEPGINLVTYPDPRQSPLADHKTLNYLYYFLAGKWAKDRKADEALILNPDGTVSETHSANILLIHANTVIRPVSAHVLPGIMEAAVCELLAQWGYGIESQPVQPERLFAMEEVLITNSLIGAVPVLCLDGKPLAEPSDLWQKINRAVL